MVPLQEFDKHFNADRSAQSHFIRQTYTTLQVHFDYIESGCYVMSVFSKHFSIKTERTKEEERSRECLSDEKSVSHCFGDASYVVERLNCLQTTQYQVYDFSINAWE